MNTDFPSATSSFVGVVEAELLIYCARTHPTPDDLARIRALLGMPLDWPHLLTIATQHHVLPQLYQTLRQFDADLVPTAVRQRLREYFQYNAIRNHYLLSELQRLLTLLEANGIPAIPYKGPLLATRFYDQFDLRHTGDLDIIVPLSAYQQAKALLIAEDFACPPMTEAEESHLLRTSQELKLWREQDKVAIEIHWAVSPHFFMFPFEQLRLWDHCQWHEIDNHQFRLPPLEDELLLLCVHGTQHAWAKLKWVSDIVEILRHPQFLDWEAALARARDLHGERMLLLGLWLAHELLAAPLPAVILAAIQREAVIKTLAAQVRKRLRCGQEQPPSLTNTLFHLRTKEHLSDRCQYVIHFTKKIINSHWQQTSHATSSPKSFPFILVRRALALLLRLGQRTFKTWHEALLDYQSARKNAA